MNSQQSKNMKVAVKAVGMVSASGKNFTEHYEALANPARKMSPDDYRIRAFKVETLLSDRKIVKAVSRRDLVGIAAFENCLNQVDRSQFAPEQVGLYVGACSSSYADNDCYRRSMEACRVAGGFDEAKFGSVLALSNPMSLLIGLPNNVLCYSAKIGDIRGPNSNYMSQELSGQMALINAYRNLLWGSCDRAFAGSFASYDDPVLFSCYERRNYLKKSQSTSEGHQISLLAKDQGKQGTIFAEGSVFLCLEGESDSSTPNNQSLCSIIAAETAVDACGPFERDSKQPALRDLVERVIRDAGIAKESVGLVFVSGTGVNEVDVAEREIVNSVFAGSPEPLTLAASLAWGNLMEASGLGEIGLFGFLAHEGDYRKRSKILETLSFAAQNCEQWQPNAAPYGLLIRSNLWGEYSCVLLSKGE